ncbi:MAG: hypothetical protein HY219_01405 [Candidatus Staskawiczbacteria bacterium]|nr:hypothetical protein [Candidatus Staskawiczbacteria bacterium]
MFEKLPNSTRKFVRLEKARIRRQFSDYKSQKEAIANMYSKILNQPIVKKIGEEEIAKQEKAPQKQQKKESTQKPKTKNKKSKVQKIKKGKK